MSSTPNQVVKWTCSNFRMNNGKKLECSNICGKCGNGTTMSSAAQFVLKILGILGMCTWANKDDPDEMPQNGQSSGSALFAQSKTIVRHRRTS